MDFARIIDVLGGNKMDIEKININKAVKLLQENGYIITRFTKSMQEAAAKCETEDGDGDCAGCACNLCITQ
jgi:hypothetical protein